MEAFLTNYISLILSVIALGSIVYKWFSADGDAAMAALKEHKDSSFKETVNSKEAALDMERRVQRLEDRLEHVPAKDDFHKLELAMSNLQGVVGRFDEKLQGMVERFDEKIEASTDLVKKVDQYLRDNKL